MRVSGGASDLEFDVDRDRWATGVKLRLTAAFRHTRQTALNKRKWFPKDLVVSALPAKKKH